MMLAHSLLLALSPEEINVLAPVVVIVMVAVLAAKLLMPIAQGYGRRLAAKAGDDAAKQEMDELRGRVAELEAREARLLELEERLDFTERLLARGGERPVGVDRRPEDIAASR